MIPENYDLWPKVILTNEDSCSYKTFINVLHNKHHIFDKGLGSLKCRQGATRTTLGNRFKKVELEYSPFEGVYPFTFDGKEFVAKLHQGECKLTT